MLDFRMYTFLTLSKTLNYTKAAQLLCMSQPSVSQHIKYLETYYQVKLFENINKQLTLTSAGNLLLKHSITMAADENKLKHRISESSDSPDHIRFGATRTIGEFYLPAKLSILITAHPDTSFTMIVENTRMLMQMLKEGHIDFAFIEGYFPKQDVAYQRLTENRFIAIKAPSYPLHAHSLLDLCQHRLIVREQGSGTRDILERILHEQNLQINDFKTCIEIGNIHAIKELVQQGLGITFLYEAAVTEELRQGTVEIIELSDFHILREFNFITLQNSIFKDVYQAFFNDLK